MHQPWVHQRGEEVGSVWMSVDINLRGCGHIADVASLT